METAAKQERELTNGEWLGRVLADPAVTALHHAASPIDLAQERVLKALVSPLFLDGLCHRTIVSKPFENFIARLRRALLMSKTPNRDLAAAVAYYAFNTEFILDAEEDELARLQGLRADAGNAALLGCYVPLHLEPDAAILRKALGDCPLARLQIDEPLAMAKKRETIEAVTKIDEGVSAKVRAQYEESPYPRWSEAPPRFFDAEIRKLLPAAPEILIAGCGTGAEAIQLAISLPQAKILAVDLSRSSLAYAMMQAERFGVKNISFRQGDILKLAALERQFDYISSQGVLHHMADPVAGWRVLCGLLKPQGVMYIGLYSEAGRQHIVAARGAIAKHNFPATPDGIRAFRRKAREILPADIVKDLEWQSDYYSLSMCRDLLFHVQEHRLDIPRIESALQALRLGLIKFNSPFTPPGGTTLEHWHKHEVQNPLIFRNMYKFWCRKLPSAF